MAAPVDVESGKVIGPDVYSDIAKKDMAVHPITQKEVVGYVVPFWKEVMELAYKADLHTPENKFVGWDIAITNNVPDLIEGNHNWCKLLWQLRVKKGLKVELEKFM